jgi:hypothetical protein
MKKAMKGAKIPVEFKSHSARHAGIAKGRAMGMTNEALMARSNMSRPTFVNCTGDTDMPYPWGSLDSIYYSTYGDSMCGADGTGLRPLHVV